MTDLSAIDREYRQIGPTPLAVWEAEFRTAGSPLLPFAAAMHATAGDHGALCLAQMWLENQYATTGIIIRPEDHNPLSMRPWPEDPTATVTGEVLRWDTRAPLEEPIKVPPGAIGAVFHPDGGMFLRFSDPVQAVREWRRRVVDDRAYKGGVYNAKHTLTDFLDTYAPPHDTHPVTGLPNKDANYELAVRKKLAEFAAVEQFQEQPQEEPMPLTYGRVPMPGYVDLQHTTADKPEGAGWDNLGKRDVLGIVLHRMWGTLTGTDVHFGNPAVPSLTDYGIGTANIDGAALDGVIHKYNDPLGYRSGWASGRVSKPYGDGAKFVAKYGINAVNRRLVSIETSGYEDDPFTEFAFGELVKLIAYYADQAEVPYTSLPLNPHTGINFIIWHEEFTFGTGKTCPFRWMKANTDRLYTAVAAYLKPFQTGAVGVEQPKPAEPAPQQPKYAEPRPIKELAAVADTDADAQAAIVTRELDDFIFVSDLVEAVVDTPRLQVAVPGAKHTGPVITKGTQFPVDYLVKAADGEWYYITGWWTRVRAADTRRVRDAA